MMCGTLQNLDGSPLTWPEVHERVRAYYATHDVYGHFIPPIRSDAPTADALLELMHSGHTYTFAEILLLLGKNRTNGNVLRVLRTLERDGVVKCSATHPYRWRLAELQEGERELWSDGDLVR